jgi:dynein heavy chain
MFARFYFVSDQALLEILSNSNNPEKVDEYIGDCFDGMKRLEFVRGPGIAYPSKRAKSMISKDTGEEVYFYKEF